MKVASPPEQITLRPARVAVEDPPAGRGSQVDLQVRPTVRAKCRIIPLAPPNRQPRERKTQNAIAMMPQKTNRKGVIPSGWKEEQSRPGMGECDRSGRTRRGIHASSMCGYYLTAARPTIRISLTQHFTSVNAEPWRDALTRCAARESVDDEEWNATAASEHVLQSADGNSQPSRPLPRNAASTKDRLFTAVCRLHWL